MTEHLKITRSGRAPSQNHIELGCLIDLATSLGVRSYLEIGSRHGDTFWHVMRSLPAGSRGLAVDLPNGAWGTSSSAAALTKVVDDLRSDGYDADVHFGSSHDAETIALCGAEPWDMILIDGDHRYGPAKQDWDAYGPMALKAVAFHDIAGEGVRNRHSGLPVEVPRLWREIRDLHECREFIAPGSIMGIGVLLK